MISNKFIIYWIIQKHFHSKFYIATFIKLFDVWLAYKLHCLCNDQWTTWNSQFPPFIMWTSGTESRLSDSVQTPLPTEQIFKNTMWTSYIISSHCKLGYLTHLSFSYIPIKESMSRSPHPWGIFDSWTQKSSGKG